MRELTQLTREHRAAIDSQQGRLLWREALHVCEKLSTQVFDSKWLWLPFADLVHSVSGLKPDCTDEEFEELFKWLGFEIEEGEDGWRR